MVRVTGVFPPGHRRRRVMEDIHYQCDKADPLSDLTRVSSQGGSAVSSMQSMGQETEADILAWLHKIATSKKGRLNDSWMHVPCQHPCSMHELYRQFALPLSTFLLNSYFIVTTPEQKLLNL